MSVVQAQAECEALASCTSFGLVSADGPLTTAADAQVYLLDAAQIVDPSGIAEGTSQWLYYKNASAGRAYCDLQLLQSLAQAGSAVSLPMTWRYCSGALSAQLVRQGGGGAHLGAAIPLNQSLVEYTDDDWSGSANISIPAGATAVGESWAVEIRDRHAAGSSTGTPPLVSLPLTFATSVCNRDGPWPATVGGGGGSRISSLPCWLVNASHAAGNASRHCLGGTWSAVNDSACSTGGWSQTEVDFLTQYGLGYMPSLHAITGSGQTWGGGDPAVIGQSFHKQTPVQIIDHTYVLYCVC
jgi:hypothetical protein